MEKRKKIVILGATGSIGTNTLKVLEGMQDAYEIYGLAAHSSWQQLAVLVQKYHPALLALTDEREAQNLREQGHFAGTILQGAEALVEICEQADLVVLSVVGVAGLKPFVHCLQKGRCV